MKARVKATGEIIEISEDCSYLYAEYYDKSYNLNELEFLDVKEKSFPKDTPDYWTRLEHQYAGMAMQGMIKTYEQMMRDDIACKMDCCEHVDADVADGVLRSHADACAEFCVEFAHALVEKLKEERK